jgi:hypothetical protein
MKDKEYHKSLVKRKYPHLSDEYVEDLYNMIDTLAYLLVEEYDFDIQEYNLGNQA